MPNRLVDKISLQIQLLEHDLVAKAEATSADHILGRGDDLIIWDSLLAANQIQRRFLEIGDGL